MVDEANPLANVRKNLKVFDEAAERAAGEHADIILFPEEGLFTAQLSSNPNLTLRQSLRLLCEDIPDPRQVSVNPCTQEHEFKDREILHTLSCIARRHRIYLVAAIADVKNCSTNCTSDDGFLLYNTQVAFDRKGQLVGRYHKYHLYGEYHFNVPDEMELVYFDTDFGARIGMYICFDRLFHDPMVTLVEQYNVTTMALSTWFFDEHPFLMSHQIDQSWSIGLNINILSSNIKALQYGSTGSGIFSPKQVVGYTHDTSRTEKATYPIQLVGTVPVDPRSGHKCDSDPWMVRVSNHKKRPADKYEAYYGDFRELVTRKINETEGNGENVCDGDLCCSFDWKTRNQSRHKHTADQTSFYLGAKSRLRTGFYHSNYSTFEQACFIVSYNASTGLYANQTNMVFDELQIRGNFSTEYRFPSALTNAFNLIPTRELHFTGDALSVSTRKPLIYAGIFARVYERDPAYVQSDYGTEDGEGNPVSGMMRQPASASSAQ